MIQIGDQRAAVFQPRQVNVVHIVKAVHAQRKHITTPPMRGPVTRQRYRNKTVAARKPFEVKQAPAPEKPFARLLQPKDVGSDYHR